MLQLIRNSIITFCIANAIITFLLLEAAAQDQSVKTQYLEIEKIINSLLTTSNIVQIIAGSALITTVINVIWYLVTAFIKSFQYWISARSKSFDVNFMRDIDKDRYADFNTLCYGINCLIIRYGTDQYISTLASDQEKYEGRLQNRLIPIKVSVTSSGTGIFSLNLPVHKRIGTQFKCFAVARDAQSVRNLKEFLENCEGLSEVSISHSIHSNRIYFIIDRFGVVNTVEGIQNNMVFPE